MKSSRQELGAFINRMGIKKSRLAVSLGVRREQVYAYLTPAKYPAVRFSDDELQRIEAYIRDVVRKIA